MSDWIYPLLVAPFVGSFLGVLILRLPAGEPVLFGRSRCPHCRRGLGVRDLVPLLSWLAIGGRCRQCRGWLGWFYPLIELAAVVLAVWAASELSGWLLWAACILGWTLLTLAVIDVRHLILPDELVLPLIPAGLIVAYLVEPARLWDHVIGATAGFLVFLALRLGYARLRHREGLGFGDVKLLAAAGAWVSWPGLPGVVMVAAFTGLLAVFAGSLLGRGATPGSRVPFGAFICLATWIVWLYGPLVLG